MDELKLIETIDDGPILKALDGVINKYEELGKTSQETSKIMNTALDSAEAAVKDHTKATLDNEKALNSQVAATKEAQKADENLRKSIGQTVLGWKVFGKTLGEWVNESKKVGSAAKENSSLIGVLEGQMRKYAAIVATSTGKTKELAEKELVRLSNELKRAKGEAEKVTPALEKVGDGTEKVTESTGKLTVAQRLLNLVMKANPIGLLIGLITSATAILLKMQPVLDAISAGWAAFGGALNVVSERLLRVKDGLATIFQGNFKEGLEQIGNSFTGIVDEASKAASASYDLERRIQALRDRELELAVVLEKQRIIRDKLLEMGRDETLRTGQRLAALKEAAQVQAAIEATGFELERARLQAARDAFALSTKNVADKQALNAAEIAFLEAQEQAGITIRNIQSEIREVQKRQREELEKIAETLEKVRLAASGTGLDKEIAAINKRFTDLSQAAKQAKESLQGIGLDRTLSPEEVKQMEELTRLQVELEARRIDAIIEAVEENAVKLEDARIALIQDARERELNEVKQRLEELERVELQGIEDATQRAEISAKYSALILEQQNEVERKYAVERLKIKKELRDAEIDVTESEGNRLIQVMRENGAKEQDVARTQNELVRQIQFERLNAELAYQQSLLDITSDPAQLELIKQRITKLLTDISGLGVKAAEDQKDKPFKNIFEVFGVDPDSENGAAYIAAAQQAAESLKSIFDDITQARLQAAQAAVDAAEKEISAAEKRVDEEKKRLEEGNANNLIAAQAELAIAKQKREAALKEEEKARKQQILLDSIQQGSSLITAGANIFKALSPLGPIGVGVAIGTIALMIGAFISAKAAALRSVEAPKLRKGAKLQGDTHERGGVDLIVSSREGKKRYEAEAGEWLMGRDVSRQHDKGLAELNTYPERYAHLDLYALLKAPKESRPTRQPIMERAQTVRILQSQRVEAEEKGQWRALEKAQREVGDRVVKAIKEQLKVYYQDGTLIEIKETEGGTQRVITHLPK
jgi:hypothetical protein